MNPAGGGISKAAGELLKEMQQAQQELQKNQEQQKAGGAESFQDRMQAQQSQPTTPAGQVQPVQQTAKAAQVLTQVQLNAATPSQTIGRTAQTKRSQMVQVIEELVNGQDQMADIMKLALSGKKLSSSELLAMQAGVYRFSQELEITSKVVEKATSGIKQTMNTQV